MFLIMIMLYILIQIHKLQLLGNSTITFTIEEPIDFTVSNSLDPTEVSIASIKLEETHTYFAY